MTEETNQLIGKMLSSLEHNTKVTEKVSDKVDKISEDVSKMAGVVSGHEDFLQNLNIRVREHNIAISDIDKDVSVIKSKHESISNILRWVGGILATVTAGIISLFIAKS